MQEGSLPNGKDYTGARGGWACRDADRSPAERGGLVARAGGLMDGVGNAETISRDALLLCMCACSALLSATVCAAERGVVPPLYTHPYACSTPPLCLRDTPVWLPRLSTIVRPKLETTIYSTSSCPAI